MSYSLHLYLRDLLSALGVPGSSQNARALLAQVRSEGGQAHWNPLNTTVKVGPATAYNSFGSPPMHVWSFASREDGIAATAQTFRQQNFGHLLGQLRRGDSAVRYWELLMTPPPGGAHWGSHPPGGLTIVQWLADVDRHWYDYVLTPVAGST